MTIPSPLSNFKNWCIFLLLIAIAILWFTRGCNKPQSPALTQNQIVNDTVVKIFAEANAAKLQAGLLMEDTARLNTDLVHARDSLKQSTRIIHAANSQVSALANEVADARMRKDTGSYKNACDSLAEETKKKQDKFNIFERDNNNALRAAEATISNLRKTNAELIVSTNGYRLGGQLLKKQNDILAKANQPKRKIYIGVETFTAFPISGVGGGGIFQDKRERLYRIAGGLTTNGGKWISGGAYLKLQFHR